MRKIDVGYINKGIKEDAVLKIKDDSCTIITENDELIKVPFSNIKTHKYDNGILTISRYGGNDINLEMLEDKNFFVQLINIENQNKDNTRIENIDVKKEESENIETVINQEKEKNISSNQNIETSKNNGGHGGHGSVAAFVVVVLLVVLGFWWFNSIGDQESSSGEEKEEDILTAEFISNSFSGESKEESLYGGTVHNELQFNEDGTVFWGMCYSKTGKCSGMTENYEKDGLNITITNSRGELHYTCYFNSNSDYKLYCKHSNGYSYEDYTRVN